MQGLLTNTEAKRAFVDGVLSIDCVEICLTQNSTSTPIEFRGSGSLLIHPQNGIEARFVSKNIIPDLVHPFQKLLRDNEVESGQIFPDSHYFSLRATELSGDEWTNPSVDVDYTCYSTGTVIVLKFDWIRNISPAKGKKDTVHMLFLDNVPFPLNVMEKNSITREGKEHNSFSYKSSQGEAGGATFKYACTSDSPQYFELFATPIEDGKLPLNFEYRIIEAIRFLSASALSFAICETIINEIRTIEIAPTKPLNKGIFPSPFYTRRDWADDFYKLLDCYLTYSMSKVRGEEFAFISSAMGGLYKLKGVSFDSIALLVAVTIESVVQQEFSHLGKAPDSMPADLEKISSSLENLEIAPRTLSRVKGSLSNMMTSRAGDKLKDLVAAKVLKADEYTNWNTLRNKTVHGGLHIQKGEHQKLLNSVYKATTSLNKIVFYAIGYRGRYLDYSILNWPEAIFNPTDRAAESATDCSEQVDIPHKGYQFLLSRLLKFRLWLIRWFA